MVAVVSPLLAPGSDVLDERQRGVVERVSAAERAHILALPSDDPLDAKRRARVQATGPELFGQPEAVRATLTRNDVALESVATALSDGIRRVLLVGAGDSLAVVTAARYALESMLEVPCEPVQSLEFAYYQAGLIDASTAVITLSSSGETTRTVEALLVAQNRNAYTVAVTNTSGSTLETEADVALLVEATRVGWPTQSSTAALALLLELAVRVGRRRGVAGAAALRSALDALPDTMRTVLGRLDGPIAAIAAREVTAPTVLFSGGGPNVAAAVVGAAKVKECTPLRATEIQVEEYHHYNSQKAEEPLFLLVPSGPSVPRAVDTGTDAHRWGGRLYVVTTEGERAFDALDPEAVLEIPAVPESLSPLLYLLPAQLVGYHLGLAGFAAAEAASDD
ncbi:SIS domain-containing protein [Spongisporangium articulatum]|uniref:Glutamine--fructose-6-phosphate aminotransferase [isomerizing] n=1 Tax=Spongisporangium articulatum TaxID=3362603 RepID=A0ABW8ALT0_9ACTN